MSSRRPFATSMHAVHLTGHGGFDMLSYRTDVPVPNPAPGEVLINVTAAGINNTDINTRTGWYSKTVTGGTQGDGTAAADSADASWTGAPLTFPRIQGADACGTIVAVGADVSDDRVGARVLVRTMQSDPDQPDAMRSWTMGSECDGGFAQFLCVRSSEAFDVTCDWSDVELASIPCAYSTAENMLHRAGLGAERVLITGASGGVGSAAIQLAKRRGAHVTAQAAASKKAAVSKIGADRVVPRVGGLDSLQQASFDLVVDLVAGPQWGNLLDVLAPGGRYITAGAIAGPIVTLDVRTLYLRDLTLMGATVQPVEVFENLVGYIERGEIRPLVAKSYPLKDIVKAQQDFVSKSHTGKLVLVPPPL